MKNLKQFVQKHTLAVYFLLAFGWSWGCWLPLLIATPPGGMQAGMSAGFLVLAILGGFGPSLAGFAVAALVDGKAGAGRLWRQATRWRLSSGWYAAALLLVPAVSILALLIQSALFHLPVELGDVGSRLALGLVWPVFSSLGEEFGWRGLALPGLQKNRSPLAAALLLGLVWGMWHLPSDFIGMRHYGAFFLPFFILAGPLNLMVQSILISWIYNRTGSLLPAILYHYSITASAILLPSLQLAPLENIAGMAISVLLFSLLAVGSMLIHRTRPEGRAESIAR